MTSRASVDRTYIAIDLKSFYASVECKERNRDPQFVLPFRHPLKAMEYRGDHGFLRSFKR